MNLVLSDEGSGSLTANRTTRSEAGTVHQGRFLVLQWQGDTSENDERRAALCQRRGCRDFLVRQGERAYGGTEPSCMPFNNWRSKQVVALVQLTAGFEVSFFQQILVPNAAQPLLGGRDREDRLFHALSHSKWVSCVFFFVAEDGGTIPSAIDI